MGKRQRESREHSRKPVKRSSLDIKQSLDQSLKQVLNQSKQPLSIDTVNPAGLTSKQFYEQYIGARKAFLIDVPTNNQSDNQSNNESVNQLLDLRSLWSNAHLKQHAGAAQIQAEKRSSNQPIKQPGNVPRFGLGQKVSMRFDSLINHFEAGHDDMYMTTQYIDDSDDKSNKQTSDHSTDLSPESRYLIAPPLLDLLPDFPLRPQLFECLMPHQLNMWFGFTKASQQSNQSYTSSGLHHDYHDNLYVLLRGRKRIVLIEPKYAKTLKTNGKVEKIHPNGLICYDLETFADGSDSFERAKLRQTFIEERMQTVEAMIEQKQGNTDEVKQLKSELRELESQLDEVLDILMKEGGESDEGFDGFVDDFVDSDEEVKQPPAKSKRPTDDDGDDPPNFSRLSSQAVPASIPRIEVELRAPAMLFIPASYFHEVFSSSSLEDGDDIDHDPQHCGHLALNYWFIPPDRLDDAEQPYEEQELWQSRWERQQAQLEQEKARLLATRDGKPVSNQTVDQPRPVIKPKSVNVSQPAVKAAAEAAASMQRPKFVLGKRRAQR